jgi:SAM-dependent methyltransferase
MKSWSGFFEEQNETLFSNAIRLRNFIWTIEHYVPHGSRLLEVGFGSGMTAVLLADMGYQVTAVDLDQELVNRMSHRHADYVRRNKLNVMTGDMLSLPWQNQEFDLAYHQGVLEHFPDEQIVQALKEQARVTRIVIFDVPNHRYGAQVFGDERLLSPTRWRSLINQAGLTVIGERGRVFRKWLYFLPYAFFTRKFLEKYPGFGRWLAISSIFVCKPSLERLDEKGKDAIIGIGEIRQ